MIYRGVFCGFVDLFGSRGLKGRDLRFYDLARVPNVPVAFFFEEMSAEVAAISPAQRRGRAKVPPDYKLGPMAKRETLQLVRAYYKISDPQARKRLCEMTRAIGAADL